MTAPPAPPTQPVSAPDLIGPVSLLNWPVAAGGGRRRRRPRRLEHVHLEVDLIPGMERTTSIPVLHQIEEALRETELVEQRDLVSLAAATLQACSSVGYRRVDHWEVRPGGWLPVRDLPRGPQVEPVSRFLQALQLDQWKAVTGARGFAARLSGPGGNRLELVLRRVHRERAHSLSIDVLGSFMPEHVHELVAALRRHLPLLKAVVTGFRHEARRS